MWRRPAVLPPRLREQSCSSTAFALSRQFALARDGTATLATSSLASGPHTVRAIFTDSKLLTTVSAPKQLNVGLLSSAVTLSLPPGPIAAGQAITLVAIVNNPSTFIHATGTVTFKDGTVVLGSAAIGDLHQARLKLTNLAIGAHAITATYSGDNNFHSSASPASSITIVSASHLAPTTTVLTFVGGCAQFWPKPDVHSPSQRTSG